MNKRRQLEFIAWLTIILICAVAVCCSATLPDSLEHSALSLQALGRLQEGNR